jgi:hypothetical protein
MKHDSNQFNSKQNIESTATVNSAENSADVTGIELNGERRLVLKMIGGTAVLASGALHSTAAALTGPLTASAEDGTQPTEMAATNVRRGPGAELTISLSVDPVPTIRMTNHSDRLIIVRHVHPGLIHAGATAYDINSIFERSAYAIGAGRSRWVEVKETSQTQAERPFPRHLYAKKPQQIVAVTGRNHAGILANSTRSYYA